MRISVSNGKAQSFQKMELSKTAGSKLHFRHCMLYEFNQGNKATEAAENICKVYGENAISVRVVQQWFSKFRSGNFELEDEFRGGRPKAMEADELEALLQQDPRQTTRELAEKLEVDHSTVVRRLKEMGKIQKMGKWVPHTLSEGNKLQRLNTCVSLIAKFERKDFLWKLVTGDEKWIYFDNPDNRKSWCNPGDASEFITKRNVLQKKVMLCVWWDMKGILYYELLQPGQTVTSERYSEQLKHLDRAIGQKREFSGKGRRKVILHHDNARPHVASTTLRTITELGWEVLPHPAYSPDVAPSDYHLFRSTEHRLRGTTFKKVEEVRKFLDEYFDGQPRTFYRDGIRNLPDRWRKVVSSDGNYFVD